MENDLKQKILNHGGGICNLTPNQVCSEDELEDCVGLTFNDDALRVVQEPMNFIDEPPGKLAFVHELSSGRKNYIYITGDNDDTFVSSLEKEGWEGSKHKLNSPIKEVVSVGNTIILLTEAGLNYFLWKQSEYKALGSKIPEPKVDVRLTSHSVKDSSLARLTVKDYYEDRTLRSCYYPLGCLETFHVNAFPGVDMYTPTDIAAATNYIVALYSKQKKTIAKYGGFVNPFYLCWALELYDGSYSLISAPILMYPSIRGNSILGSFYSSLHDLENGNLYYYFATMYKQLKVRLKTDYSEWSDVIRNVTLFCTNQIEIYDTSKTIPVKVSDTSLRFITWGVDTTEISFDTISNKLDVIESSLEEEEQKYYKSNIRLSVNFGDWTYDFATKHLQLKSETQLLKELETPGPFYKLCDIGIESFGYKVMDDNIGVDTLNNLTTQPQLKNIDFYSHTEIFPRKIAAYNHRLNAIGIKRTFFEGFSYFLPYNSSTTQPAEEKQLYLYVYIHGDDKDVVVRTLANNIDVVKHYFFYPDPRAYKIEGWEPINGDVGLMHFSYDLKESSSLNGAYYFNGLPDGVLNTESLMGRMPPYDTDASENLNNYIIQTDVDNPWNINASGYTRVGQGTIIGMAALTTALSQDAYKVATTIAFTTQGIWALSVNNEGEYASVAPPFSREVCSNPDSITMVDNGVFFVSRKGLMMIEDNGVRCVSEQLNGKLVGECEYDDFNKFLQGCRMAYDYRSSLLWLINTAVDKDGKYIYGYHWIYNMKSGSLTRMKNGQHYTAIVGDYPDTLLQNDRNSIYSFLEEPGINDDEDGYDCSFITRPLKLSSPNEIKSVRQLEVWSDLSVKDGSKCNVKLLGSTDLDKWFEVQNTKGNEFKYFKIKAQFTGMKACDTYSGTLVNYVVRRNDKMR